MPETAQNTATQVEKIKIRMIFLYENYDNSKKTLQTVWARTNQPNDGSPFDRSAAKILYFGKIKSLKYLFNGNVYEFDATELPDDGLRVTFSSPPASEQERWKNKADVAKWSAVENAAAVEKRAAAKLATAGDAWKENLEPFQKMYRAERSQTGRAAILAAIISEITKG